MPDLLGKEGRLVHGGWWRRAHGGKRRGEVSRSPEREKAHPLAEKSRIRGREREGKGKGLPHSPLISTERLTSLQEGTGPPRKLSRNEKRVEKRIFTCRMPKRETTEED